MGIYSRSPGGDFLKAVIWPSKEARSGRIVFHRARKASPLTFTGKRKDRLNKNLGAVKHKNEII